MGAGPSATLIPKKMPNLMKATYLGPAEEFLWEGRPSGFLYYPLPVLLLFLVSIYNLFVWDSLPGARNLPLGNALPQPPSFLSSLVTASNGVDSIQVMVGLFLLLVAIIFFAIRWFKRATTVFALSNTRFIRQQGLISKDFDEIQLRQIRGIEVTQTGWQRLLGYGTVRLSAEAGGGNTLGNEVWKGFPRPSRFQRQVEAAQETLGGMVPQQASQPARRR